MENHQPGLKRIQLKTIASAGYFWAHECLTDNCSEEKLRLFKLENEMSKHFSKDHHHRSFQVESLVNQLAAVKPFRGSPTWLRAYVLEKRADRSELLFKVQLIDHCYEDVIEVTSVKPLSSEFDTSTVECQGMKIILYGIEPAYLKLELACESKLSGSMQFYDKHKKYIEELIEEAEEIYFQEVRRVEEFYFGHVFLKQKNGVMSSLEKMLLESQNAIECADFKSKIPEYIKKFRRHTFAFDHDLSVRKMLYPSIQFSDANQSSVANNLRDDFSFYPQASGVHVVPESTKSTRTRMSSLTSLSETMCSSVTERMNDCVHQDEDQLRITTIRDLPDDVEEYDSLIDKILVVGSDSNHRIKAVSSFTDLKLDSETFQMLERMKFRDMSSCQKYLIPAVLSGQNVILIDGPKTGKTLGALIALVSLMRRSSKEKQTGLGARAIVVCPYSVKCESVRELCLRIIQGRENPGDVSSDPVVVDVAYGLGTALEKAKLPKISKGFDILVCTPRRLLRLLENYIVFDFKRLSHIIFDDMDTMLNSYGEEITQILAHVNRKPKLPQRIIISNHWVSTLKKFIEEDVPQLRGFLLIPCYLDAALFVHLKSVWKYVMEERKKLDSIVEILNEDTKFRSVVIVFSEDDDIDLVHRLICRRCTRQIYIVQDLTYLNSDTIKSWQSDVADGKHPVLFCTDYTLCDLRFYEADSLIHYSLPKRKMEFYFRFRVLLNRLQNVANEFMKPRRGPMHPCSRPETFIYSNSENMEQFPSIVEIMRQLNAEISDNIQENVQEILRAKEIRKELMDICPNLKEFGRCVDESCCEFRHVILAKDAPDPTLPTSGYVKVHIIRVFSPTHYGVRLLEHATESSGPWRSVEKQPNSGIISFALKIHFGVLENEKTCVNQNIGDVLAIRRRNDFYRVKIIRFVGVDVGEENEKKKKKTKHALVKFIDEGQIEEVPTISLLQLPESLASRPPAIVDLFVCNLLPIDEDIAWGSEITEIINDKINILNKETDKSFFVGKIELVFGRNLFFESLEFKTVIKVFKETVTAFSVTKMLRNQQLAVPHEQHLLLLLQKCRDVSFKNTGPFICNEHHHESGVLETTNGENAPFKDENILVEDANTSTNDENTVPNGGNITTGDKNALPIDDDGFAKPAPVYSKSAKTASKSVSNNALKPRVDWRQDSDRVYLTILVNSDDFSVEPTKRGRKTRIYFRALLEGKLYEFNEVLFSTVLIPSVHAYKSGVSICVRMTKLLRGIHWRQLFRTKQPCKWVRVDGNYMDSSDDESVPRLGRTLAGWPSSGSRGAHLPTKISRNANEFVWRSSSDTADDVSDSSVKGYDSDN